jgi:hypothetical protein
MLNPQTQSDLESLLAEQDRGWCNSELGVTVGIGGCLVQQMDRLLVAHPVTAQEYVQRKMDMIAALGFLFDSGGANPQAMFNWNDEQRDPDVIRHRIKDALNHA